VDPGSTVDHNLEDDDGPWITQLIPTMNKFVPSTTNLIEGEQRTIVDTSKRSRVASLQATVGRSSSLVPNADTDVIGTILVKVISARGLPVKELSISALPVSAGPFTLILPKIMVQISIVPSSLSSLVYKSGAQPRGPTPVFREDFLFRGQSSSTQPSTSLSLSVSLCLLSQTSISLEPIRTVRR
jgi:hypothetical protein